MARGRSWADDNTTQVKFAGGGSLTLTFKGNLFDLTEEEGRLLTDLRVTVQRYNQSPTPESQWPLEKQP